MTLNDGRCIGRFPMCVFPGLPGPLPPGTRGWSLVVVVTVLSGRFILLGPGPGKFLQCCRRRCGGGRRRGGFGYGKQSSFDSRQLSLARHGGEWLCRCRCCLLSASSFATTATSHGLSLFWFLIFCWPCGDTPFSGSSISPTIIESIMERRVALALSQSFLLSPWQKQQEERLFRMENTLETKQSVLHKTLAI